MSKRVPLSALRDVTLVPAPHEACGLVQLLRLAQEQFGLDVFRYGGTLELHILELREKIITQVEMQQEIASGDTSTTTRE